MAFHYIAVEGPIGVGKTTVVEQLGPGRRADITTVREGIVAALSGLPRSSR